MKENGAFRTIGELSAELRIKPHILRYWEEQFPMLQPLKRAGGRRHYRPEDVTLVQTINRLVNHEGYTIKGACKFLASGEHEGVAVPATSQPMLAELRRIRSRLARALEMA
ncbi:MAG: MerR family transcriptional regulator [Parasphingorhabdus sp.]|nr:MerR family transcriptional regulator [Parasphingorhabdus sp.]